MTGTVSGTKSKYYTKQSKSKTTIIIIRVMYLTIPESKKRKRKIENRSVALGLLPTRDFLNFPCVFV